MTAAIDQFLELQFVAARGLSSWDIEYWGGGKYSHVDIVWPDGRLFGARSDTFKINGFTYDSGVQFRPNGYAAKQWKTVSRIRIPCTYQQKARGLEWALKQEWKHYDWRAIVAFAIDRNWRDDDAWFCSELAVRMLEVAFDFELVLTPNKINPGTGACIAGTLARIRHVPVLLAA